MRDVEGMLQDVRGMLQGVDDRVKDIGIRSYQVRKPSNCFLPMFWLRLGVEETGRQMANVDDKVQGVFNTNKGVHDKVMDVEDLGGAAQDIEAKVIDGVQVVHN